MSQKSPLDRYADLLFNSVNRTDLIVGLAMPSAIKRDPNLSSEYFAMVRARQTGLPSRSIIGGHEGLYRPIKRI